MPGTVLAAGETAENLTDESPAQLAQGGIQQQQKILKRKISDRGWVESSRVAIEFGPFLQASWSHDGWSFEVGPLWSASLGVSGV